MDVIHSWWVPALTGKMDAIPGRINSLRFVPETTGDFEGKCAELCGVQHAFMPTTVTVLNQDEFESTLADAAAATRTRAGDLGRGMRHVSRPRRTG